LRLALWLVFLSAAASLFLAWHALSVDQPEQPDGLLHTAHGPPVARWLAEDAAFVTDPTATVTPTPTATPTATATATPTATPEPTWTPVPPPPPTPEPEYVPPPAETVPEPEPVQVGSDIEALICSFGWDCETALRIARCESGLNPTAYNGYHIGLFQVDPVLHTWRSATGELWSVWGNLTAAWSLYQEVGWSAWSCW